MEKKRMTWGENFDMEVSLLDKVGKNGMEFIIV
jgi:hypothetical protein